MKILHLGDLHIGKALNGYNLLEDQKYALDQVLEMEFDTIIIAGDIYDRSIPSSEAIGLFEYFLNQLIKKDKYIIIISGNHDSSERLGFMKEALKESNIYIFTELTDIPLSLDDCNFYPIPFKSIQYLRNYYGIEFEDSTSAYKYIIDSFKKKDGFNICIMHDYIAGSDLELSDSERPLSIGGSSYVSNQILKDFNYVALGHIHGPQKVGNEFIRYSGSLLKYSFSEVNHKKSACLLDTKTQKIELIPIKPLRDMVCIKGYINDVLEKDFFMKYNYSNDYFRVELLDVDCFNAQNRLKSVYTNLMEVSVGTKDSFDYDIDIELVNYDFNSLFNDFYNMMTNEELSSEEKSFIKKALEED